MQYVKHGLLFTTLCLLLSMAHVVTPELSSGETIIQWFEIPAVPKGIPTSYKGYYYGRDGESLSKAY